MSDPGFGPSISPGMSPGEMMDDPAGSGADFGGYGMMNGSGGGGWVGPVLVVLLALLLLALLVGLGVALLTLRRGPTSPTSSPLPSGRGSEASRVLDGRLAQGEVSPEEYASVRTLLDRS